MLARLRPTSILLAALPALLVAPCPACSRPAPLPLETDAAPPAAPPPPAASAPPASPPPAAPSLPAAPGAANAATTAAAASSLTAPFAPPDDDPRAAARLHADAEQLASEMIASTAAPASTMDLYADAFAGYALVNAGLDDTARRRRAVELLDGLLGRVKAASMSALFGAERVPVAGRMLARSAALRGHLALLSIGRALLAPLSAGGAELLDALVAGLAADVERDPNHLLPTSRGRTWPADSEVVAAALSLYRGPAKVQPALASLRASLAALEKDGLPPSAVAEDTLTATDVPRGCALSWTVAMRGLHDRTSARALYERYRGAYWVSAGTLAGFREWPLGVQRAADVDSGPIVLGVGAAATALGIGASRLAGFPDDTRALLATASAAGLDQHTAAKGRSRLERAIAVWARTARPWS